MQGPSSAESNESRGTVPANLPKDLDIPESEVISIKPSPEEERIVVKDPTDPEPHRQRVTLCLISMLAGLIFVHYLAMFYLDLSGKKLDNVSNAFNATLPVIAGLAGSAVTYYFTRRSDK